MYDVLNIQFLLTDVRRSETDVLCQFVPNETVRDGNQCVGIDQDRIPRVLMGHGILDEVIAGIVSNGLTECIDIFLE